jgi:hypothetical protein
MHPILVSSQKARNRPVLLIVFFLLLIIGSRCNYDGRGDSVKNRSENAAYSKFEDKHLIIGEQKHGCFRDFDLFRLIGIDPLACELPIYHNVEVISTNCAIVIKKNFTSKYQQNLRIERVGNNGFFSKKTIERFIPQDSWLWLYFTSKNKIIKLIYFGNTEIPHNWRLHSVEIIKEGPIIWNITFGYRAKWELLWCRFPTATDIIGLSTTSWPNRNDSVFVRYENVLDSSANIIENFEGFWSRDSVRFSSVFWTCF